MATEGIIKRLFLPKESQRAGMAKRLVNIGDNLNILKARELIKENRPADAKLNDFSQDEYLKMYRNARITTCVSAALAAHALLQMAFAESVLMILLFLMMFVLFTIHYLTMTKRLYAARLVWSNWEGRDKGVVVTWSEYANSTSDSSANLLPVSIYHKAQTRV